MRHFFPLILFGALCALLFSQLMQGPATVKGSSWPVGEPLPAILLPVWDGSAAPVNAATPIVPLALPKGQAYVVNLFASWCAPCKAELPQLAALRTTHGVPIVGVAWKDSPQALAAFLNTTPKIYHQVLLLDDAGKVMTELGATGVPETLVVGADGRVLKRYRTNLQTADVAEIAAALRASSTRHSAEPKP